jgi:ribosome-associated toxin RatA of RatAB toxin-antitoxin module
MPNYGECHHVDIRAPRERCYAALIDAEQLPRWQRALREARVLERDGEGRPAVLEYEVDARVRTVRYRIRQSYFPPDRIASAYLGGDFRDFGGEWRFLARDDGTTRVELDLTIDPGRFVPGPVRSLIADAVMRRSLADLKTHLEAGG